MEFIKPRYLFRLDDVCPTMNWDNFDKLKKIFYKYDIKPIVGVIPDSRDSKLNVDNPNENFWNIIKELHQKGWIIAQHGYQHLYINTNGGILNINKKSEFAGLSYEEQLYKIKKGKEILEYNLGIKIEWWMAPAHSFDESTCRALKNLEFKYITDGISLYPFEKYGLTWIPQQIWKPRKKFFGAWTICIHPNSIDSNFIKELEKFISSNINYCLYPDLSYKNNFFNYFYHCWWKFKYKTYKLLIKNGR